MLGIGIRKHAPRFVSSVAICLFALALLTRAGDPLPTDPDDPQLSCPASVPAGQGLYGQATDDDPPLVVTARYVGIHLNGSPDTTQTGDVNSFCFSTGGVPAGAWIVVCALDGTGRATYEFVKVTP